MQDRDLSLPAYNLYSQAVRQQISFKGLSNFLVHSSYKNHIDTIDTYPLEQFLANANMKPQLAAYVYHLLITDPAHKTLMHNHKDMVIKAATFCLENSVTGREANSLYQFYWAHCKATGITGDLLQKAEAELSTSLTQFELTTTKDTKYVYITLEEKRGTQEYAVPENSEPDETESHYLLIEAPHSNFSYSCLGAGRRTLITEPLQIRRMTPLANPELYQHFYDNGDRSFNVLAYLTSHYLAEETPGEAAVAAQLKPSTNSNLPVVSNLSSQKAISIFEAILEDKSLQKPYRMKILAALGHLHHTTGNHTKAQECYALTDMTTLPPAYIKQTLNVCIQTKEHAIATQLIAQNYKSLPAKAVYEAIHQLLEQTAPDTHKHLAEAALYLLLSGHNSEAMLTTVLTHYHASQSELKALSHTLQAPDPRLDMKILSGDLWAHICDTHTQAAFRRLMRLNGSETSSTTSKVLKECTQFIEYCTYAMLTQNMAPEYDTINILEKYYLASNTDTPQSANIHSNTLLLLALGHTYLTHNITTFRSDKLLIHAIAIQEAAGILLPVFKEAKPVTHPYLEKYQPFLFKSQPGKDIRLNYRLDVSEDFREVPMQYLAYGLYTAKLPLFYNETVTYYYSEEMPTGSITTHQLSHKNTTPFLHNHPQDDFFAINNAVIHEHMFRHQELEDILEALIKTPVAIQGQLL